ncbi:MAG TPA: TOBE domain-containing protein [Pyrinomonadaceae bacterium]|nr:TOBE domain-containing protein [Pyrinomonadaceae bacterium]
MVLKASGISERSAERWKLRDVSFEIDPGQIFGVFADQPETRASLLNILGGFERPVSGQLWLGESELLERGLLRANTALIERPPIKQNASWISRLLGTNRRAVLRSNDIVAEIEASAAPIVILVEPFLDRIAEERDEAFERLKEVIRRKQIYCMIASFNFEDAMTVCEKVLVLADGEVCQVGTPNEVYCEPASRQVARITGRNNIFEARRLSSSKAEIPEFQTLLGSHRIATERVEKRELGALNQNVFLSIRPEHISVSFGASFPEDNVVRAVVKKIRFLGPTTLVHCDASGLSLTVHVMRLVGLNIGDECLLGLPPDRIRIFTS